MTPSPMRAAAPQTCEPGAGRGYPDLDDRTLLGLMIQRSGAERDRLAGDLLDRFGGLGEVVSADLSHLVKASGAPPSVLADLALLRELVVRLARSEACRRPVIASWGALVAYVRISLAHQPREQFRALYLDRRNGLLRDELTADVPTDEHPVAVPCR